MNFHTVVPYLELLVRNGLAKRTECEVLRYKTTAKWTKRYGISESCIREL